MSKRTIVMTAVVLLTVLGSVPGAYAQPDISDVDVDDVSVDGGDSINHDIQVSGDNVSEASVNIDSTPAGVTVNPSSIDSGGDATLQISTDSDADSGQVSGDVDGERFSFDLTVRVPTPGFDQQPLDTGDILVGESKTGTVEVEDVSGNNNLDGVNWEVVSDDPNGDLSFSGMGGITGSGGTADWTVDVDNGVDQHEELSWTVELEDQSSGRTNEVDVEARVIYPGYIENLDFSGNVVFDEPREDTDTIDKTIELNVENGGDLPLDLTSSSVSTSDPGISADITEQPDEVGATSDEEISVGISASTDLSEGDYDISGSVSAEGDDDSVDDTFSIRHGTEIAAGAASIGDVPIGESRTGSTQIEETLGYNNLDNIQISQVEGPNQWISQQGSFDSLEAQGSESAEFAVEFDTAAEIGETYEWVFEVEGEVDNKNAPVTERFTVSATPIPLNLEPIKEDLGGYDSEIASQTIDVIDDTDERVREGSASDGEISSALAFGDSADLYLESSNNAESLLAEDDHEEAQDDIIRAASSYNTMVIHAESLNSPGTSQVLSNAEADVDDLVSQQTQYYETQLTETNPTLLEEASIKTQLAQLERLAGNTGEANRLEDESDEAFDEYTETVSEAEQSVQNGDDIWTEMNQNEFTVVIGQPLLLNPIRFGSVRAQINEFDASYTEAISSLETAGADSRADSVSSEYNSRSTSLLIAQISLFVLFLTLIGSIVGVIWWTTRQMYRYAEDTEETVSGDFLLS